jgi:hypothetical protein
MNLLVRTSHRVASTITEVNKMWKPSFYKISVERLDTCIGTLIRLGTRGTSTVELNTGDPICPVLGIVYYAIG